MVNDFSRIGFRAETDDDLRRIYEDNRARLRRTETADGTAEVLAVGSGPELWFYGYPGQEVDPTLCEPFFRFGEPLTAKVAGVFGCEESPCPVLELRFRGDAFALNMLQLNHLDSVLRSGDMCRVQLSLIAQYIQSYHSRRDFYSGQPGRLDCPAVVPWLDLTRSELREPLAHCVGHGSGAERRTNPLSQSDCQVLTLNCFGVPLPIVTDYSFREFNYHEHGNIVDGVFWVCGTAERIGNR